MNNLRLKQKVAELEDFKQQTSNLEERTENFLKEKELFEKQVEYSYITVKLKEGGWCYNLLYKCLIHNHLNQPEDIL